MNNINFANPYLLLVAIPILLLIIIPFIITFKKDNIGIRNVFSLLLHVAITVLVCFVLAGMSLESVITETNVYVVADVSYSSNRNLDTIDEYIDDLQDGLPRNSKVGVVCFGTGNPYVLAVPGQEITSVRTSLSSVNQSGTDIASALRYTATLFDDNVIKRIILITDGDETNNGNLVGVVNELASQDVFVDAVFIDNNIPSDTIEAQINEVEFTQSTYKDKKEVVQVSIQSNRSHSSSRVEIYKDNVLMEGQTRAPRLTRGTNVVSLNLDTSVSGTFNYRVEISVTDDTSSNNNTYQFTQTVNENLNLLFISSNAQEEAKARELYENDNTEVTFMLESNNSIPFTVEELCKYDEYILSSVDIRNIRNKSQFISNLNLMVSRYGKSLTTLGNTYVQSDDEDVELNALSNMLPVQYGNNVGDGKVIAIIMDISRSMEESFHINMARTVAKRLVNLASETDTIMVIGISGITETIYNPTLATAGNKLLINQAIDNVATRQGTLIGSAVQNAHDRMRSLPYADKQAFIITDGQNAISDPISPAEAARLMYTQSRISVSAVGIGSQASQFQTIAANCGGKYYNASNLDDLNENVFDSLSDVMTDTVVSGVNSTVVIERNRDEMVSGITSLPNILGFYFSSAKNSATIVLDTIYSTTIRDYTVPIYSYWNYGNGRVSAFSCDLSSFWIDSWQNDESATTFMKNMVTTGIPDEHVGAPFIFDVESIGTTSSVVVLTPTLNQNATLLLTITDPNGNSVERSMVFTSENYITSFESNINGTYRMSLSYTLGSTSYSAIYYFDRSYQPEYDSFEYYEISNLNHMVNNDGSVFASGDEVSITNDLTNVTTFTYDFTVLFMIISVCLFVLDITVRKVKWADIKNIFKKRQKRME